MAGPWEAFQQADTSGPWAQFAKPQQPSVVEDVAKSAAIGIPQGTIAAAGMSGDLQKVGDKYVTPALESLGQYIPQGVKDAFARGAVPDSRKDRYMPTAPTSSEIQSAVEEKTGDFYKPQTAPGKYANAATQAVGNPISWVGPGGIALKGGAAVLSGLGGEAGRQAADGTAYEGPAQLAGSLAGGVAAVKALGAKAPQAAVPKYGELKAAANADYNAARQSGLELNPQGPAAFAAAAQQKLTQDFGHTGGALGTAPGTFAVLDALQNIPPGATVTAANLDAIRKNLALRARATVEGKPTSDAQAASVALEGWNNYLENVPQGHVLAGNAQQYVQATKQGNANYAAAQRLRTFDNKVLRAENNAKGGIATSLDNQLKSQARTILNNPKAQRGFNQDEMAAMQRLNDGTLVSNTLRQAGRGGAGVIPIMGHLAAAGATGGASIPLQIAIASGLYGARKGAQAMTVNQAKNLSELIAQRSPLYESRVLGLPPPPSTVPNQAALIRALIGGL